MSDEGMSDAERQWRDWFQLLATEAPDWDLETIQCALVESLMPELQERLDAAERDRDALREALHLTAPDGIRQPRRSELEYNAADDVDEDVMRMTPRQLTDDDKDKLVAIKGNAASLHGFFGTLGTSRELSLAKTKLEEAVMWAVKHVTA